MSEEEVRAPSGRFIRPAWKRMPTQFEKAVAITLVLLQIALVWSLTFVIGLAPDKAFGHLEELFGRPLAGLGVSPGKPLSAPSEGKAPAARTPASDDTAPQADGASEPAPETDEDSTYARGRKVIGARVAQIARVAEKPGDRRATIAGSLGAAAAMILVGTLVAFFAWRLRRVASAFFGGGSFFVAAFIAARVFGLSPWTSALVSMPPAFLGALIGWHLVVLVTCMQSATILTVICALPVIVLVGLCDPTKVVPVLIAVWALFAGLVYVFMVRSLLISAWAMWGAWTLGQAVVIATFGLSGKVLPWEAYLAAVTVLALAAVVVQFRLASRAAEEAGALGAEPA
jgi:hypothetical protein